MVVRPERHKARTGRVTFKVRFRHGLSPKTGKAKLTSQTFDTKAEAVRFATLLDVLGPEAALDHLYTEQQQAQIPSLDDLARDHIETLTGIEPGTRLSYERLWARTWAPLLGPLPANRVTRDDVARAVNKLAVRYSAKSLKNQRGLLAAVCGRGVRLRYMVHNPTEGIRLPRTGVSGRHMRLITLAQFEDIYARMNPQYQPLLLFLAGTGARWGEAVALTVADVDLPNVHINQALKASPDGKRRIGPPKTEKSIRTIVAPARLADVMAELVEGKPGDALVFTAHKGGMVNHRRWWKDYWLPAVEHMSPRPRPHDLRHSHVSWLLADGVPVHVVQARLGHESIETTVGTYGHLLPDAQAAAARAADSVFGARPRELG